MPVISVIMGVYNCKNTEQLNQSVRSIIDQSFKDWELIICDDGSNDHTFEKLKKLEKVDSRIKVIGYSRNKGLAYALNKCIDNAKGKYIARQDDDDISDPKRLEMELKFITENPQYDIVGTNAKVYNDTGVWGKYSVPEIPKKKDFLWNNPFIHPTVLMTKESLVSVGGYRVTKETRRCEDYDLFMRMYIKGYSGFNLQNLLYMYRIENGNKKKRPMKYRIDEFQIRLTNFPKMQLGLRSYLFAIKPLVLGLIPQKAMQVIKKKVY